MAQKIKAVNWEWTQGNYGFAVIFRLTDIQSLKTIDIENYNFFVNIRRGENPKNIYSVPCRVVDIDERRVEYLVTKDDLIVGDEYYYLELQALHKDLNPNDSLNEERKISSQEQIRIFVRRKIEN